MKRFALIITGVVVLLSGRAGAQEKFRVASGGFSTAIHAVVWAAYEKKLFQKYGLDGEYLALESGTPAMQALLANELQIVFTTGALAITANLQGADTTIIAGGINFIPNKLLTRPEIKTPEALKGKRIAISRFGSASDYSTHVALEKLGINPKDVTIVQVGGNLTRLAALSNGTVQATLLSEPLTTIGIRQYKLNSLIDLAETGVPFPQNCFIVKRSYLESNRAKIVNGMKAIIEGYYMLKHDKPVALQLIKKYIRVNDEDATIGYDYYLAKYGEGILVLPDRKGLEFIISQVAATNPKAKGQTPESLRLLDATVLDEMRKSGFLNKFKK
ncbi:MAG TPA: ABC transporter substrate-binding protein [Candidatus Binatia bacterium]|jgi:NitT/TauT family transport system substrate-binding protein